MRDEDDLGGPVGPSGPLRLLLSGPDDPDPRERTLADSFAVIGRDPSADLVLDHPDVSRRHAFVLTIAGRLFVVDLGSRAGTLLGDRPVDAAWAGGEAIGIGPYLLRSPDDPGGGEPPLPTSRAFELPGATPLTLEFPGPVPEPGTWRASRVLVLLGRSPACRVRFADPAVARLHAALVRTPEGPRLIDLLGRPDGTLVNGEAVRSAFLGHGDELRIGGHPLRAWLDVRATTPALRRPEATALPAVQESADPSRIGDPDLATVVEEFGRMQEHMADQFQQALLTMFRLFGGMHKEQMDVLRQELAHLRELSEEQRLLQARLAGPAAPPLADRADPRPGPTPSDPEPSRVPRKPGPRPAASDSSGQADAHVALMRRLAAALQEERQGGWQKILGSMLGKPN